MEKPQVNPELLKELHCLNCHPHRLLVFIVFYAVATGVAFLIVQTIATPWCYLACLPL